MSTSDYGEGKPGLGLAQTPIQHDVNELLGEKPLEVDMGAMPDEEKVFKIVDKDSGRMYDVRNEAHVNHLSESTYQADQTIALAEESVSMGRSTKKPGGGWSDWWAKKA